MQQVTLVFLLRGEGNDREILLAMKKRGFGKGLWNGVGGKAETHETVTAAAIRECHEEIRVRPMALQAAGRLAFQVTDKPEFTHDISIFTTENWEGQPAETEEMRPQWFSVTSIPYDMMWADDIVWLPLILEGRTITGRVTMSADGAIVSAEIVPDTVQL